jgi:prepilin-type N-terminal cleavage/methylation domain-containing protein
MQTEHIRTYRNGFSLVELILYIAILSIVVSAVTLSGTTLLRTYVRMQATQELAQAGASALERISREIRFASAVDIGQSTLGSNPGTLALTTRNASGTAMTVRFSVSGGRVMYRENAGTLIPLTHAGVTASNLVFTRASNSETQAVRVDLTLQKTVRSTVLQEQFRTFVVLDES